MEAIFRKRYLGRVVDGSRTNYKIRNIRIIGGVIHFFLYPTKREARLQMKQVRKEINTYFHMSNRVRWVFN
jgi:hypothetical protein